ncbi:MAG: FecCD family ABC transporter permease [Thermoprotei archaeon]
MRSLINEVEEVRAFLSRRVFLITLMYVALIPAIITSIALGPYNLSLLDVMKSLFNASNPGPESSITHVIIWYYRVPRTIAALVSGAILASAGAIIQGVTRNPLASPFTLGISSASSFGAALTIIAGAKILGLPQAISQTPQGFIAVVTAALLFSFIQTILILTLAYLRGFSPESIILVGIATTYIYSAGITFLQYFAGETNLKEYVYWVIGDLARVNWGRIYVLISLLVVLVMCAMLIAWDLNALSLGDETAKSLGVNPRKTRFIAILIASATTAVVVSITGSIAFICLMAPHIARLVAGSDNRYLIPTSVATGALLLVVSDTIARTVLKPAELPVGAVTSLLGALFFMFLYSRYKKRGVMSV